MPSHKNFSSFLSRPSHWAKFSLKLILGRTMCGSFGGNVSLLFQDKILFQDFCSSGQLKDLLDRSVP